MVTGQKTAFRCVANCSSRNGGTELDDWLKTRFLIDKSGKGTVVILQPATHHALTQASLRVLKQWTFLLQMDGDDPVEGEVSVRIHFRTK